MGSLNPPLYTYQNELIPVAEDTEVYIISRNKISFQIQIPSGNLKYTSPGRLFLTTTRIVFCSKTSCKQHGDYFDAFVR